MKNAVLIVLIIYSSKVFACSCMPQKLIDRYANADFVATVDVLGITQDSVASNYLNVQYQLVNLYKGNINTSIKIRTNKSMCNVYTPKNTKWLIFANKDMNGILSFGYCSGIKQLDKEFNSFKYPENVKKNYQSSLDLKLELLKYLKENSIAFNNKYSIYTDIPNNALKTLKKFGIVNEKFALFELMVNDDLTIRNVNILKDFDNEKLNNILPTFIKKNLNLSMSQGVDKIPKPTKIIIPIYHYNSKKEKSGYFGLRAR